MLEICIHIVAIKQKAKTRTHHTQTAINKLDACEKENANVRQRVNLAARPAETNSTSEGKLIGKSNRRRSNGVWPAVDDRIVLASLFVPGSDEAVGLIINITGHK